MGTIKREWNTLGQKTSMTVPLGAGNKAQKIDYYYDHYGRMVGTDVTSATVTSSSSLSSTTASETQFYYDANLNRVKMVTTSNATAYDGTYYYVYDPTASIPAVVYEQGPTYRYVNVREPDGSLVGRRRYSDEYADLLDQWRYHFDGLGNTVALSAGGGAITDRYSYDAWGKVTHPYGSTDDNPYQFVGQLGYYTHYQEPNLALMQLGVRYYDPGLGRFTSGDAARSGINRYSYAIGNPLGAVDPDGRIPLPIQLWPSLIAKYWNWFRFYFNSTGDSRSLLEIGVHSAFWDSEQVTARRARFEKRLSAAAEARVAMHGRSACIGKQWAFLYTGSKRQTFYDLDFTLDWTLAPLGHTNVTFRGGCTIRLDCCRRLYWYVCGYMGTMVDAFEDVDDVGNHIPGNQELLGGVAYGIYSKQPYRGMTGRGQF